MLRQIDTKDDLEVLNRCYWYSLATCYSRHHPCNTSSLTLPYPQVMAGYLRWLKVTLSCPVTALRSGKEPPSIFGHKSTKSCSKSDTWVGRGLAQDGRLGEPGGDHRPGWLKHLRLCCSSHGCNWRWPLEKTSMKKKTFSFGHCPNEEGGRGVYKCLIFLAIFQEVHFWSIKRVYFLKNANVLNF